MLVVPPKKIKMEVLELFTQPAKYSGAHSS